MFFERRRKFSPQNCFKKKFLQNDADNRHYGYVLLPIQYLNQTIAEPHDQIF